MARIAYDRADAAAFAATRHLSDDGRTAWREAVTRYLGPAPGRRIADIGAGTGSWAGAFTTWFPGVEVIAIEPSAAMRARSAHRPVVGGDAEHLPLADATVDAVWISTVLHHVPDLPAAAREICRVLRPGGTVLVRSAFPGRHEGITLFRYFPEAVRVLDSYPSIADVTAAFAGAGLEVVASEAVPQRSAASLAEAVATLRRAAHTPLQLITDDAYAAGLDRMRRAAAGATGPVIDHLDLLVLR
jgi:SAM-dependent methyltransferase